MSHPADSINCRQYGVQLLACMLIGLLMKARTHEKKRALHRPGIHCLRIDRK